MRRKTSHSTRHGSNADGLNSSLESNSGASSHYFSVSTMYAPGLSGATPPPAFSSGLLHQHPGHGVANLSRLRYCSLGHSDPQLYTLSTYTHSAHSVPVASHCSPHAGHRHHQRSIGHASHVGGGLLGYVNPSLPTHSIDNTAVATTAAVSGGTRRSFLSASSLTPTRLRKESLLVTSPRASIGGTSPASSAASGGSSSGGRRRHLDLLQSSPSPSCGSTSVADRRHSARRSIGGEASSSAAAANFGRIRIRSSTGAAHHLLPSTSAAAGNNALLRQPIALRAGGGNGAHNLAAPANKDNRRWSLASLPSSSGYGTPGSNSAFSSQYSSQEHLAEVLMDMRVGSSGVQHNHFDSNDSYSGFDELIAGGGIFGFRPRSRSLTSPLRAGSDGGAESAPQILSSVYKERFPKAKAQMESRLQQFLIANAPLSGFTSSAPALNLNLETCVPLGTTSSGDVNDSSCSYVSRTTSPTMSRSVASDIPSAQQLNSSANTSMRRGGTVRGHSRSTSPRPTSVLPPRPISPLAIGSATASADGVVFRSISPAPTSASRSNLTLCAGGDTSLSPASSSQNLDDAAAVTTSIESATPKINSALIAAAHLSHSGSGGGGSATSNNSGSVASGGMLSVANRSHRSSFIITAPGEHLTPSEHALLRIISDGATRFLHHQLCEICADCLLKSRDDILTCAYFCNMSVRLDETLAEAEVKVGAESYKYLAGLVRQILMIVSRTARLLECLEFDPDEFYQLLEEAEGTVREQLGCGSARVPDLPQYIIGKLGLNKNLLVDQPLDDGAGTTCDDDLSSFIAEDAAIDEEIRAVTSRRLSVLGGSGDDTTNVVTREKDAKLDPVNAQSLAHAAPREEDYESIRLISNGAYGAVYLVRHHQTRQRFALKKMKKQTLILRNQVDQVYAERDILTFTDNPFVVCFYGSFETRQHLCMLMEYVEGGDCAALLKSAGTLPIELTRLYVAETVLAIEYLHSCGIVHRDLKPDNLLITTMGHIKLTDFGLSKIGLMNRTTLVSEGYLDDTQQFKDNQLCGTPEYIAPCVILRQGYGKPVDWWALGIILYEFLIGVVPFMGDTPEELFANIINEEVEYPEGDEALDLNAESLIRMLLEKNPVDRLGTVGGAAEVASHPFFNSLDFDSLLRQKAEFVPQLENEEDTSYFDSREDRYNHEVDSGDDENAPMFWSFSTASPRHSIVGLEIPTGTLAGLQALAESNATASCCADETGSGVLNQTNRRQSAFSAVRQTTDSQDCQITDSRLPPSSGSVGTKSLENQPIPSAVILRRRFSAARHANLSTSSSGTTVTGPTANTCSSTDSSVDASHFSAIGMDTCGSASRRHNTVSSGVLTAQLPRLAISPCTELTQQQQQQGHVCGVPIRRAAATVGNVDCGNSVGQTSAGVQNSLAELSPVEETTVASSAHSISALLTNQPHDNISDSNTGLSMEKRPSTVAHALLTDSASSASFSDETFISRSARSLSGRSNSLRVMIPQQQQVPASNASSPSGPVASLYQQSAQTNCLSGASSVNTSYYHSYGVGGGGLSLAGGQLSPSSCRSVSSISSLDGGTNSPSNASEAHPPVAASSPLSVLSTAKSNTATTLPLVESDVSTIASHDRSSSSILSISQQQHLPPPPIIKHPHQSQSQQQQSKKIKICKGPQGYGFTIRSVRVYLSEVSEYYTIEHIVAVVREPSPAYDAGLRENDLITHVHMQPVHNLSHPQLMHRLLSCGGEITLHVTPLNNTSIREGEARRNVGKLLRKKPRRPGVSCGGAGGSAARRSGMEKKPRKASALLRRLSGKRTAGDIVPGTSSQKQTFMPRSVSSQDGALAVNPVVGATPKSGQYLTTADAANTSYSATSTVITPATNSVSCRSPVLTSGSLRHHSSFKGISGGGDNGDGKSPPLIASTFHQKRLSDFGIGCSASSSSPLTSTTNSSLGSGDFLHLQPMASAHYLPHTHQSPLVASSKSAPLPPVQDNVLTSTNFKNSGTTEISDGDSTEKLARLTLTRPNTLIQNPTSPTKLSKPILDNFLPSLPLPRVGADISSVSKTTGNTLTMPAVPSAQMTLNNANGGLQQRSMPLSPLARQSSSSSTIAAAMAQQQQNQVITHQPASRRMSGLTSIIPVGTTATSSQKRDSNTDKKEPTVNVLSAISTTTSMTTAKVYRTSLDVRDAEQQKNKDVTQQSGRHRSPSPPRKISPSRIMHRIFRVGSQSAAHTSQSTNSGTNSPNEISNNSSLSASSASPKHTGIRKQ